MEISRWQVRRRSRFVESDSLFSSRTQSEGLGSGMNTALAPGSHILTPVLSPPFSSSRFRGLKFDSAILD